MRGGICELDGVLVWGWSGAGLKVGAKGVGVMIWGWRWAGLEAGEKGWGWVRVSVEVVCGGRGGGALCDERSCRVFHSFVQGQ